MWRAVGSVQLRASASSPPPKFRFLGLRLRSFASLPPIRRVCSRLHLVSTTLGVDSVLLTMAMAALGLTTHVSAIRAAGIGPTILAGLLFAWLVVGGLAINVAVQRML